jgi:hypothetical protein
MLTSTTSAYPIGPAGKSTVPAPTTQVSAATPRLAHATEIRPGRRTACTRQAIPAARPATAAPGWLQRGPRTAATVASSATTSAVVVRVRAVIRGLLRGARELQPLTSGDGPAI